MERKRVPQDGQRIDAADRLPHHRRAGLGRQPRAGRGLAVAVIGAEDAAGRAGDLDAAQHQSFADECDAGQPPAAIADRFAHEQHPRPDRRQLFQVEPQVAAADRVAAEIAERA